MSAVIRVLTFLLLLGLYLGTCPVNHTEADVAFRNAWVVEQGAAGTPLRADEVLYLAAMRGLYGLLQACGWGGRAFDLMVFFSAVCAALTVQVFFLFCYRRFSLRPLSSLLAAALLAVSYGFWRYACEAEAIVPATLAALVTMYWATSPVVTLPRLLLISAGAAVAMLLSVLNAGGVLLVIPLYFLLARRPGAAAAHVVLTAAWLATGLLALGGLHGTYMVPYPQLLGMGGEFNLGVLARAAIGLGQSWLSGSFLLGIDGFRHWLVSAFPYRMLVEEVHLGRTLGRLEVAVSVATFVLALALAAVSIAMSLRQRRNHAACPDGGTVALKDGRTAFPGVVAWAAVYAACILWLQPENAGVWAFGLAPIWLAFCGVVIVPLARSRTLWPILALAAAMALHNYVGGLRLFRSPRGDAYVAASRDILARAGPEDAVLLRQTTHFSYWLRLHFAGRVEVLDSWTHPSEAWAALTARHPRIWAPGTLFNPEAVEGVPKLTALPADREEFLRRIRGGFRPATTNAFCPVLVHETGGGP